MCKNGSEICVCVYVCVLWQHLCAHYFTSEIYFYVGLCVGLVYLHVCVGTDMRQQYHTYVAVGRGWRACEGCWDWHFHTVTLPTGGIRWAYSTSSPPCCHADTVWWSSTAPRPDVWLFLSRFWVKVGARTAFCLHIGTVMFVTSCLLRCCFNAHWPVENQSHRYWSLLFRWVLLHFKPISVHTRVILKKDKLEYNCIN